MQGAGEGSQPTTVSQNDNFTELVAMGFDATLVTKALQLTNDKERAIELVLKFQEEPPVDEPAKPQGTEQAKATEEQKLQERVRDAVNLNTYNTLSYKMVLVVRQDLGMGVGKIAAQVGHAVLGAYKEILESQEVKHQEALFNWEECGQAKIVLKIKNKEEIIALEAKARANGLNTYLVADAGRTQIEAGSITVCAIGPGNSAEIDQVTGHLRLM
jgi:PTH2 family peptidyl-tRNA hydrolase